MKSTKPKAKYTPKPPAPEMVAIKLSMAHWRLILAATKRMANRCGRDDAGAEATRARAIPYLESETAKPGETLTVRMTKAGAAVLAEDCLQIAWNTEDGAMAAAGAALTEAAAHGTVAQENCEDE